MNKVGIMGGTFNPIHQGHLILAEQAYEQFGLDHVLFMPSKNPPHKNKSELLSDEHRTNMVMLAIDKNPHFAISTLELEREGTTYTADTLNYLTKKHPDTLYYYIVGADSLFSMQNWMDPQTIFLLSTIIVAGRDTTNVEVENHIEYLNKTFGAHILQLSMPNIEISSRIIRERIAENKTIRYYIPDEVIAYIKKNSLFATIPRE